MDEWLVAYRGLQSGDPKAYEFLMGRLGRGVWTCIRRMCGGDELTDELFNRTWLRLVETARHIRSPHAIRQYVLSVARREWLQEMERRRREPRRDTGGTSEDVEVADASPAALEALARQEDIDRMRGAVDGLPESLREVVVLRVYGELTFAQISEVLGIPLGTALTRMRLATHRLAKLLDADPLRFSS